MSAPVTITGIDIPVRVSSDVYSSQFSIGCTGTFQWTPARIENGQTICMQVSASPAGNYGYRTSEVTIGGCVGRFTIITDTDDITPDPFSFGPKANVSPSAYVYSDPVTITGLASQAWVRTDAGSEVSVGCSSSWQQYGPLLQNGQTLCVRHLPATIPDTVRNSTIWIGDVVTTFSSSTGPFFDTTPDPFVVAPRVGVRRAGIASAEVVVTGLAGVAPVTVTDGWLDWYQPPYVAHEQPTFRVHQSTAASFDSPSVTAVTVGGVSGTFTSRTIKRRLYTDGTIRDFDGNGFIDVLWRNVTSGDTAIWLLDEGSQFASAVVLAGRPEWSVTHAADLDGDGRTDLVWRNAATGETALWLMDGLSMRSGAIVVAQPRWKVTHVGDFDGDGRSDLIWVNNDTGETVIWLMTGLGFHDSATLLIHPDWRVDLVADLDGSGKSDLVWHNAATGATAAWLMNGKAMVAGTVLVSHPGWRAVLNADLDGDGSDDLVWHNPTDWATAIWLMNGTAMRVGAVVLSYVDLRVVMAADDDADGKADLQLSASHGYGEVWVMNGLDVVEKRTFVSPPDRWVDFDGDGEADRLMRFGAGYYHLDRTRGFSVPEFSFTGWEIQW